MRGRVYFAATNAHTRNSGGSRSSLGGPMNKISRGGAKLVLVLWIFVHLPVDAMGQEIYILSTEVQQFAKDQRVYEKLGAQASVAFYVDTITGIDVIAHARAGASGTTEEDYEASAWLLCILPWTPSKTDKDKEKLQAMRGQLLKNAFLSQRVRNDLLARINLDRLRQ